MLSVAVYVLRKRLSQNKGTVFADGGAERFAFLAARFDKLYNCHNNCIERNRRNNVLFARFYQYFSVAEGVLAV